MLDLLPEAVVVVGADGSVAHVNDRARAVLGLDATVVGRRLAEVLVLADDAGERCGLVPAEHRVGERLPERVLYREGDGRPVAVTARRRPDGDGWVFTARPAGRREALARVQGDVVATVSHEIRSPLSSVKGFTRTLLTKWERFSDEQRLMMLATVDADADRVTRLLLDLLEVSRIDAGRVRLRRASVDVAGIARAVVDAARHRDDAAGREVRLTVERVPRIPGDLDRLRQVVTNLVENALTYAPDGVVEVRVEDAGDGILVTVSDEGPGVDPRLRAQLFRKFARGRDDRTAGTGLGLYISRGLVQAHGGRIWLDEDVEVGATFRVWLPHAPLAGA